MTPSISAYMLTFNNEHTIERALASLSFVDEIIVVDSGSSDKTLDIVRRFTDRLIERPWSGFRDQYQFAADQCQHDWLLFLDADEEISESLAVEIKSTVVGTAQVDGYAVHRRTFYLNRWILHGGWLPDDEIRLYRRNAGSWQGDLHAKIEIVGETRELRHFIYHYTYRNISDQLQTIDKYSTTAVSDMHRAGRRFSLLRLIFSPGFRFVKEYVFKLGFLDGFAGFVVAVNTMFYVFVKQAKLWEHQHLDASTVEAARAKKPE